MDPTASVRHILCRPNGTETGTLGMIRQVVREESMAVYDKFKLSEAEKRRVRRKAKSRACSSFSFI
jgi:hypothetical protein